MLETYLMIATHPLTWVFVGLTLALFLMQWLVSLKVTTDHVKPGDWLKRHYVLVVISAASLLAFLALVFYLVEVGISVATLVDRLKRTALDPASDADELRGLAYAAAALLGVMAAAATIFFSIIRVWINERNTTAVDQGHITDRINKAVEGLGAEKNISRVGREVVVAKANPKPDSGETMRIIVQWGEDIPKLTEGEYPKEFRERKALTETEPNLEVRIGAIYALERIAKDSDRDHVQIMEILCAYIRQNAKASEADPWPELEIKESEDDGPLEEDWAGRLQSFREAQVVAKKDLAIREDIQVALTVIGRRSPHQRALEARANGGDTGFVFDIPCPEPDLPVNDHDAEALHSYKSALYDWRSRLNEYRGYRLDLRKANLRGADLSGLCLNGARLDETELQGADMKAARLQGAYLAEARLQGAPLGGARLQGAYLGGARLQGAYLVRARLQRAYIRAARFDRSTNLPQLAEQADMMFGDGSVTLPSDDWPSHWGPKEKALDLEDFLKAWRAWQATLPVDPQDD